MWPNDLNTATAAPKRVHCNQSASAAGVARHSQAIFLFERTFFEAASSAERTKSTFAAVRATLVEPCLPQAPAQGLNTLGALFKKARCCSGVSFTIPWSSSG